MVQGIWGERTDKRTDDGEFNSPPSSLREGQRTMKKYPFNVLQISYVSLNSSLARPSFKNLYDTFWQNKKKLPSASLQVWIFVNEFFFFFGDLLNNNFFHFTPCPPDDEWTIPYCIFLRFSCLRCSMNSLHDQRKISVHANIILNIMHVTLRLQGIIKYWFFFKEVTGLGVNDRMCLVMQKLSKEW